MKKYLIIFVLAFACFAPKAHAVISFVNAVSATSTFSTGGQNTSTITVSQTAGNFLFIYADNPNSSCRGGDFTIKDSLDTPIQLPTSSYALNGYACIDAWYIPNISSGTSTITTNDSQTGFDGLTAMQFSGVATTNPLDTDTTGQNSSETTGKPIVSPAYTTTNANDVVVAGVANYFHSVGFSAGTTNGVGMTAPASTSIIAGDGTPGAMLGEYLVESATLTGATTSMALSGELYGVIYVAAFKAAGGGASSSTAPLADIMSWCSE